jgi:hypothetical protein
MYITNTHSIDWFVKFVHKVNLGKGERGRPALHFAARHETSKDVFILGDSQGALSHFRPSGDYWSTSWRSLDPALE